MNWDRGTDTTELNDDLPGMVVSIIQHPGEKIRDYHNRKYEVLCTCHHFDETVWTVNKALPVVAALAYATTAHIETDGTSVLEQFLQARTPDDEYQAGAKSVRYFA